MKNGGGGQLDIRPPNPNIGGTCPPPPIPPGSTLLFGTKKRKRKTWFDVTIVVMSSVERFKIVWMTGSVLSSV